jgi:hypothetical protein
MTMAFPDNYPHKVCKCTKCGTAFNVQGQAGAASQAQTPAADKPKTAAANQAPPTTRSVRQAVLHRTKSPKPLRMASLAWGLSVGGFLGIAGFGLILGALAVYFGRKAQKEIQMNPGAYKGEGWAKAGVILGTIDFIGFVVLWLTVMIWISIRNNF